MNATLITAMNNADFRVFPQKNNPRKTTASFKGEDGHRYFITRVATSQVDAQGRPVYIWATGKAMRDMA